MPKRIPERNVVAEALYDLASLLKYKDVYLGYSTMEIIANRVAMGDDIDQAFRFVNQDRP